MNERQFARDPRRISVGELKALLDTGGAMTILDVRAEDSYARSSRTIPGAIRIEPHDLRATATLPKQRLTVTFCT